MSQSPEELPEDATLSDLDQGYVESAARLNQLIDRGASWSGHEKNCCFLNTGQLQFANVSAVTGLDFADDGRAVGLIDWDFDGDLDFWTVNRTAPRLRFVRNDWQQDAHWAKVKLRGTSSNRDAIGARVELVPAGGDGTRYVRTLRAGEAFLSQSSKWLHFGLGNVSTLEKIIVHWPGGEIETFDTTAVDQHIELVEGTGQAQVVSPPQRSSAFVSTPVDLPAQSSNSRALLTRPFPIPPLNYIDRRGRAASLEQLQSKPLFLNLWATWCRPCLLELKEFAAAEKELKAAGLQVLALSVDHLNSEAGATDPAEALGDLGFSLPSGAASEELAGQLEIIINYVYGPDRPLPLPVSVLLDASGKLAAIYKGPTSPEQVIADAASLAGPPSTRLEAVVAHPGQWVTPPGSLRPLALAAQLANAGYENSVAGYVSQNRYAMERDPLWVGFFEHLSTRIVAGDDKQQAIAFLEEALAQDPDNPELLFRLGGLQYEAEQFELAEAYLRRALSHQPKHPEANFQLGNVLNRKGKFAEAATSYLRAIAGQPKLADAHYQLATVLFRLGKTEEGMGSMRKYLTLEPTDANAQLNLGVMLAMQKQLDQAAIHLQEAVKLDPKNGLVHNNLGRVRQDQGRDEEAVNHYRQALTDPQTRFAAQRNLAWILATSGDDQVFNADEAIGFAEACVAQSKGRDANSLGKLAAAFAAGQKFPQAIEAATKAIQLAMKEKNEALQRSLEAQRTRYQAGQSLRRTKPE